MRNLSNRRKQENKKRKKIHTFISYVMAQYSEPKNSLKKKLMTVLACVIVFATTYSMILPAITIDQESASTEAGFYLDQAAGGNPQDAEGNTAENTDGEIYASNTDENTSADMESDSFVETTETAAESETVDHGAEDAAAENAFSDDTDAAANAGDASASAEMEEQWMENVTDAQITTMFLSDSGELFEVTVSYDENAQIPDGATLKVTEFDEQSQEYQNAWKDITGEDYLSDPDVDAAEESSENEMQVAEAIKTYPAGMVAMDITIYDSEGREVEPDAPVSVSIIMKSLPEDLDTDELSETTAVHHFNETPDGTVVETVATGDGTVGEMTVLEDSIQAEFTVDSFSTYTITWGSAANTTTNLRLRESNSNRAQITVHYVDQDGHAIARPAGINANTDQTVSWSSNRYTYNITTSNLARTISGYTYQAAHSGSYDGTEISSVTLTRSTSGWSYRYSADVNSIYLVYSGSDTGVTVHYGYMSDGAFVEFTEAEDGDVPAGTVLSGPTQYGDQLDLEKTIPGYRYVTSRLNDPVNGREISSLLNTDPPYKANTNNTFENASLSAYPSYTSSTAPTSFVSNWRYRQLSKTDWNPTGASWDYSSTEPVTDSGVTKPVSFAETDKDIYVIYEKGSMSAGTGEDGGTDIGELSAPRTEKQVVPNQDGTYDVSLSVTGESKSQAEKTKANIVIILDTSWSMYEKDAGKGQSRLAVAKSAIGSLADKLFALNAEESDTIELAFITFAQRVRNEMEMKKIYSGTDAASFKNMVNGLDCASGTNWDDALYAADHIYFNDDDPTYIVFVTDGDPISCAHPYGQYNDWDGGTYYTGRTNYEYALAAKNQADSIIANNKTLYTIGAFGEVSNLQAIGGTYLGQANDSDTINGYFDGIIADIRNVLGYEDVTIYDGITDLTSTALVNGNADQFRYAVTSKAGVTTEYENGAALQAAYPGIGLAAYNSSTKTVEWNMGSGYMLEDGVTYKTIFTVWPSQEAYDYLSDFNNRVKYITQQEAAVKKQFVVETADGLFQFVDGKGWTTDIPAKETSAYITDDAMQNLIDSASDLTHYLKTNTRASIDYTSVKTENGEVAEKKTVTGAEIRDPNGKMILDGTNLQMEKVWNDDLDKTQLLELLTNYLNPEKTDTTYSVTLHLWQDIDTDDQEEIHTEAYGNGFVYKPEVRISNGEVVSAEWSPIRVAIAPGVMVKSTEKKEKLFHASYPRVKYGSDTYIILETGHTYEITEDDIDLHFELDTDVYHPMVVNGILRTVKFGVDEQGNRIITEMSEDNTALTTLTAANNLKGGLDIQKFVTTKEDASDIVSSDETFFTFKIKLQKSQTDTTPVYTTPDQFDENGNTISGSLGFRVFAAPVIPSDATDIAEDRSSYVFDGLTYTANRNEEGEIISYTARGSIPETGEITLRIRQSALGGTEENPFDRIRVVNVPAGTCYTVTETDVPAGYEIVKSEGISGTVQSNSQVTAAYWNKRTSFSLDLLKVDELDETKTLSGAEFSLFLEDASTPATDAEGNRIGTIHTGTDGKAEIGALLPGTYKLVETVAPKGYSLMSSPVTIIVTSENVTFQQGMREPADAEKSSDGFTWTVTVTNHTGYELPATGGPGTTRIYLLGSILILGAGVLLWRRRKIT